MTFSKIKNFPIYYFVFLCSTSLTLAGCDGDDGVDGADGGDGLDGAAGLNCWDLNENGLPDPEEDLNGDGVVDTLDCNAIASGAYEAENLHTGYFTEHEYEDTGSCLNCHGLDGEDMLTKAHFSWQGVASNIEGFEGEYHGKNDLINNFCIAVPTNEDRCSECHAGYGYSDKTFSFADPKTVDCLVCHDQTGTYKKGKTTAGLPDPAVDLTVVARSVAQNGGKPGRSNCIGCHAKAGGGDNVKHGDLSMSMLATTREFDVHMGVDGGDFACVDCHGVKKDAEGTMLDHGIGGMPYHSTDEGAMKSCEDCHGNVSIIHAGTSIENTLTTHTTLACQVCHIPTFARDTSTKVEWYWADAGQDIDPVPVDPDTGRPTYDKKKGTFVWENNVTPALRYFDGKWSRFIIGANDQYTTTPVVLGAPVADYTTPGAMIYPFKKMIGNQVADANNNTILVPHLFGLKGGPNPYWGKYDWDLALQDGANYTGQTYSGEFEFVNTVMYLTVNHEIAPKEEALGMNSNCGSCHLGDQIEWTELGWSGDPALGGTRPD